MPPNAEGLSAVERLWGCTGRMPDVVRPAATKLPWAKEASLNRLAERPEFGPGSSVRNRGPRQADQFPETNRKCRRPWAVWEVGPPKPAGHKRPARRERTSAEEASAVDRSRPRRHHIANSNGSDACPTPVVADASFVCGLLRRRWTRRSWANQVDPQPAPLATNRPLWEPPVPLPKIAASRPQRGRQQKRH